MKRSRTLTAALVLVLVLLAPAASAQLEQHVAWRQEREQLSRNGTLRNALIFVHLSCADGDSEGTPPADCQPVIRLLVRRPAMDMYRLPALPPNLVVDDGRLRVDKQRLKQEKGDLAFFAQACQQLPQQEICDENWQLKKVWTVSESSSDDLRMNLRTALVRPGVTSHQIGSETPDQTLTIEVSVDALGESVLIPLWEQNGILNVPATFSPRG